MVLKRKDLRAINVEDVENFVQDEALQRKIEQMPNLIVLDTIGDTKGSRNIRKLKTLFSKESDPTTAEWLSKVSPGHVRKLEKARRDLRRSRTEQCIRRKLLANTEKTLDLWGGDVLSSEPRKTYSKPGLTLAPAVKLPHPGQSINPSREAHQDLLEREASKVIEAQRVAESNAMILSPLNAKLEEYLSKQKLSTMTLVEKQQAWAAYHPSLAIELPQDGNMESEVAFRNKLIEKKSRGTINREKRYQTKLKELAERKSHKQFMHSFQHIKAMVTRIKKNQSVEKRMVDYWNKRKMQKRQAESKGLGVQFKRGRYHFKEAPESINFSKDIAKSRGSLRMTKIPVESSVIIDRSKSVQRRGLVQLPPDLEDEGYRIRTADRERKQRNRVKYVGAVMRNANRETSKRIHDYLGGHGEFSLGNM